MNLPAMLLGLAVSAAVTARGGEVRISFLRQSAVLLETFGILRSTGCSEIGTLAFQCAVERSNSIPFGFDFGRFPEARAGFYAFPSAGALVRALPGLPFGMDRPVDINCFDTAILLMADPRHFRRSPQESFGPFLITCWGTNAWTNGWTIACVPMASDAFNRKCQRWYQEDTRCLIPPSLVNARQFLTAELFRWHLLPRSAKEATLREAILTEVRLSWRRQNMVVAPALELVLCHQVDLPRRAFHTTHAGILVRRGKGYTYVEKAGACGPFVRLDLTDRADLGVWLAGLYQGCQGEHSHLFATFNDTSLLQLRAPFDPNTGKVLSNYDKYAVFRNSEWYWENAGWVSGLSPVSEDQNFAAICVTRMDSDVRGLNEDSNMPVTFLVRDSLDLLSTNLLKHLFGLSATRGHFPHELPKRREMWAFAFTARTNVVRYPGGREVPVFYGGRIHDAIRLEAAPPEDD